MHCVPSVGLSERNKVKPAEVVEHVEGSPLEHHVISVQFQRSSIGDRLHQGMAQYMGTSGTITDFYIEE